MPNEEPDIVELEREDGDPIKLRVARYFYYNGEEYVLLSDDIDDIDAESATHYIMQVKPVEGEEDMEEFLPIEDDVLLDKLAKAVENVFDEDENDSEDD